MIDVHYASLASRRVQHRVFYLDGHPSRYQPRPTGLNDKGAHIPRHHDTKEKGGLNKLLNLQKKIS